jgi:hypothetical protein
MKEMLVIFLTLKEEITLLFNKTTLKSSSTNTKFFNLHLMDH